MTINIVYNVFCFFECSFTSSSSNPFAFIWFITPLIPKIVKIIAITKSLIIANTNVELLYNEIRLFILTVNPFLAKSKHGIIINVDIITVKTDITPIITGVFFVTFPFNNV